MPQIPQYEAPQGTGLHPTETGINATAGAARRLQGDYSEAAAAQAGTGRRIASAIEGAGDMAVKYIDHQQISEGAKTLAQLTASATQAWNDTVKNADPTDPTVAKKFVEENLEPALDKFKQGFITDKGQQFAEQHADALRQHMYAKTSADMVERAGQAVHSNTRQTANNLASAVYNDPSSLDFALKTWDSTLDHVVGSSPNLSGVAAGKVKTEISESGREAIVKSAVLGMIRKDPNVDLDAIQQKYGKYINGAEMGQFQKAAQSQAKQDMLTQKGIERENRDRAEFGAKTDLGKVWSDSVSFDENGKPSIKGDFFQKTADVVRGYQGIGKERAEAQINWAQGQLKEKKETVITDPSTQADLYTGLFKTDKPTTDIDILRAANEGKLDDHAASNLLKLHKAMEEAPLKGPVWTDTMDAVKSELVVSVPGIPGKDTVGIGNYAKFAQTFIPQYTAAMRAGTLPPNALDTKDPESMISKAMAPFKRSQSQRLSDYVSAAGGLSFGGAVPEGGAAVTLPPIIDRRINQTYPTPNGMKKWTGTGWVNP